MTVSQEKNNEADLVQRQMGFAKADIPSAEFVSPQDDVIGGFNSDVHLTIMGTGTSVGVPVVGCDCAVCTSDNLRNRRMRSGVLVKAPQGEFVIDTGPELRLQLLQANAQLVRAAVFTHAHADHILGLDDLRIFSFRLEHEAVQAARQAAEQAGQQFDEAAFAQQACVTLPLFCEEAVEQGLRQVFAYAFTDPAKLPHRFAAPRLRFIRIAPNEPFELLGVQILPVRLKHGQLPILGFRIGNVAFCTDVSTIPAESRALLEGLDVLILDALRYEPHPTHLSVDGALKIIRQLKPKRTYLTHMSHELDYDRLCTELPADVRPAWDGLKLPITGLS